MNRRSFLTSVASAASLPILAPGAVAGVGRWLPRGNDRSLIVLEFDGGNDGLNTILPIDDAAWARARPLLSSVRNGAHKLKGGFALHPSLKGIHQLMRDGLGAAIHGVGYEGASRSHFKNRDIWHTADIGFAEMKVDTTGWLGRCADQFAKAGAAVPGLSVGSLSVPLMLKSKEVIVPSVNKIEEYQLMVSPGGGGDERRAELVGLIESGGGKAKDQADLKSFLDGVAKSAVGNAQKLRESLAGYKAKAEYPNTALGRKLQLLARILVSGFGTRLFHVNYAGFDTHATQLPNHSLLLRQFSEAMSAMVRDLKGHGLLDRVAIVVQSEFGRRVAQNKSRGTDHGKAGPVFVFGGGVKPGLHGEHPSLTDLDDGDLKQSVDFREIYASALRWLKLDPKAILGAPFRGVTPFG